MEKFIHVRSSKFPILAGEREELVNEGMFGKGLALYLQTKLRERGYEVPFVCAEDWGWWVSLKTAPFALGVCVYAGPVEDRPVEGEAVQDGPGEFACTTGAPGRKVWSWKKFGFIDTSPWVNKLHEDLLAIFQADGDVQVVGVLDEMPDLQA